jgi:hypothetical protein
MRIGCRRDLCGRFFPALAIVAVWAFSAHAGFWALPIDAELDLAEGVVVGKITRIEPTGTKHAGKMQLGKA